MITLFRACTLEDWTDLFYTSYYGCESYGYDKPTAEHICARYNTGTNTIYLDEPEPCNVTLGYQCYDPFHLAAFNSTMSMAIGTPGSEMIGQPYHPGRTLFKIVTYVYWILFIFIGSFVLLSLFVGAITIGMQSSMQEAMEEKAAAEAAKKAIDRAHLHQTLADNGCKEIKRLWSGLERQDPLPEELPAWQRGPLAQLYIKLARKVMLVTESSWFNNTITAFIVLASIMVGLGEDDYTWAGFNGCPQVPCGDDETNITDAIEFIILMVFAAECALKIVAEGMRPWRYLYHPVTKSLERWNCFDFVIVVLGLVGETGVFGAQGSILMVLRLLRLLRVLKLVRALPQLQVIVSALISGIASIGYVSILLILIYYIYAILGCIAFGANDPWHFRDVTNAMLTLFRASTFEDWTDIMYINMYGCEKHFFYQSGTPSLLCNNRELGFQSSANPALSAIYFVSFILLAALVMMSLFIGVVTTAMDSENRKQETAKADAIEIAAILSESGIDEVRLEELRGIFNEMLLPNQETIGSRDLGFLLDAVADGKMPQLEREERIDQVLDGKELGELTFNMVVRVLAKLQNDRDDEAVLHEKTKARLSTATRSAPNSVASQEAMAQSMPKRSYLNADGRLVLDLEGGKPPKKSATAKVRRLLEHAEGFDIPSSVELKDRGLTMLVTSVATMRLHAQEVATVETLAGKSASRSSGLLSGVFNKPEAALPGDGNKVIAGLRKAADGRYEFVPDDARASEGVSLLGRAAAACSGSATLPGAPARQAHGEGHESGMMPAAKLPPPGITQSQASTSAPQPIVPASTGNQEVGEERSVSALIAARQDSASAAGFDGGAGEKTPEYLLRLLGEVEQLLEESVVFVRSAKPADARSDRGPVEQPRNKWYRKQG